MSLKKYLQKRNFSLTQEPKGHAENEDKSSRLFVVQKHAASHLHYDFRLELSGVLKSWAVPKGPSLDPTIKRLAVEVEDHPLEYAQFSGIIPEGQYGAGNVSIWDHGTWVAESDPIAALKAGKLNFTLFGKKLHGQWSLIRLKMSRRENQWLLIKKG